MRKLWVILSMSLVLALGISASLYAKDLSAKEKHKIKVDQRVEAAYLDIVDAHNIKESDYIKVPMHKFPEFFKGQGAIKDQDTLQRISQVIGLELWDYLTIGSIKPNILIAPDGNEVLLLFKEKDGNNVVAKATWDENGETVIEKTDKKGYPIPPIEE